MCLLEMIPLFTEENLVCNSSEKLKKSKNKSEKRKQINNSLIEMQLKIKINVQIILPFSSKNIIVENKIPLKTKIIQGKIPEYYGCVLNGTIKNE